MNFENKIAFVTGASSGIGEAAARLLAARGATVVVAARRVEKGAEVVEAIKRKGGKAEFMKLDVSDEEQVRLTVERIVQTYGQLDLAVNNAGVITHSGPLVNSETDDFRRLLDTNVIGLYTCMKYELEHMLASGGGAIVNVSSINGVRAMANSALYTSTKFAVEGMTRSTAREVADRNIRINSIAPGMTKTEIVTDSAMLERYAQMIPMKRMGNAEEIAAGIAWLLSDEASFATGSTFVLDGGFTA
jgi:NAD(P)-dependent dehydrogenase (short-subunit alcohol dehydrogenase family)